MSSANLERILDEVRALTPDEKRNLREALDEALEADERARREVLVRSIRGKYAHLGLSSEGFAALKAEEIELEDKSRG